MIQDSPTAQEVENDKSLRSQSTNCVHLSNFDLNCSKKMCYKIFFVTL
jgi:hypothetical protein